MRPPLWVPTTAALAAGLGIAALVGQAEPASAAPVQVTAQQLLINQRISQAGVRRSNTALQLLGPLRASGSSAATGWGTSAIANAAITAAKLAPSAVNTAALANDAVTTAKIANGAVTAQQLGPGLATNATAVFKDGPVALTAGAGPAAVATLSLPAGSYSITGKAYATAGATAGAAAATVNCRLSAGTDFDQSVVTAPAAGSSTLPFQVVHQFTAAGAATLACSTDAAASVSFIKLTALTVPQIANTASP